MLPEKFMHEYKALLARYQRAVLKPTQEYKEILGQEFRDKYNLSDNQIDLLDKEPPF